MCELFGLSGSLAMTTTLSLERLARHGGPEGHLADGWGIGFYDGPGVRLFREPASAAESVWVAFIAKQKIRSPLVMSHLRHATQGEVCLRNTQPFAREVGGRMHLFTHNGRLPGIERHLAGQWSRFRPLGTTDSEIAFCVLLERLAPCWSEAKPGMPERLAAVVRFARDLRQLGPANFLYADGEFLFAHGDRRVQRDGRTAAPGLHLLLRECAQDVDAPPDAAVAVGGLEAAALVASVPLTDESWRPLAEGEIVALQHGALAARAT